MKNFIRVFGVYALVPLLIAGFCVGFVWRGNRQHENDKALLAAINANDTPAVIAALKNGANPNARYLPDYKRSLKQQLLDLLHPDTQSDCPTGHRVEDYNTQLYFLVLTDSDNVALVKALLDA